MKKVTFWESQITTVGLCVGSIIGKFLLGVEWRVAITNCFIYMIVVPTCWCIWFKLYQN